ncbi:hypothetical protein BFJ72_g13299 [Fusarium proliferatum]|uniref:Uncharacterized protein n=1 Tax=Gibberella intermedia TaxID=948311 RepID=A0A420SDC3_GIBIN|nr:hypothetical protein BFJ72_g13299 [Fusarium proliferatum]
MPEPLAPLEPEVLNTKKALKGSSIKDKQVEAAALDENSPPKPSPTKKTTPSSGKKRKTELSLDEEIAAIQGRPERHRRARLI